MFGRRQRTTEPSVRRSSLCLLVVVGLAGPIAVGCSSDSRGQNAVTVGQDGQGAPKSDDGEERRDLEPLTNRFQGIGSPVSAIWRSGTTGDDRVPGPSTYWIDAIVMLDPGTAGSAEKRSSRWTPTNSSS